TVRPRRRRGPPARPTHAPGRAPRGPRLYQRQAPRASPGEGHYARDRPPQHRTWLGSGRAPLGGGAIHRAAALVPPTADPLGDSRRHPRSLPQPRLRHHLLASAGEPVTLLGALSAS